MMYYRVFFYFTIICSIVGLGLRYYWLYNVSLIRKMNSKLNQNPFVFLNPFGSWQKMVDTYNIEKQEEIKLLKRIYLIRKISFVMFSPLLIILILGVLTLVLFGE